MRTVILAAALVASACGGSQDVVLGDDWPETAPPYDEAYQRWTRHDRDYRGVDMVIEGYATLKAPEWRVAYAAAKAREAKLSPAARAALFDEEHKALGEAWEVELVVATHDYPVMDFASSQSMWRMTLVGDEGREVVAVSVREDSRARPEVGRWFKAMTPFHRAYVLKFPKLAPDGQPLVTSQSPRLELRIGSALANVEFVWER